MRSTQVGRVAPELAPRWDHARRRAAVLDLLEDLPLDRLITHRFPFDAAADAYRTVAERPEEAVQVILTYDAPAPSARRAPEAAE